MKPKEKLPEAAPQRTLGKIVGGIRDGARMAFHALLPFPDPRVTQLMEDDSFLYEMKLSMGIHFNEDAQYRGLMTAFKKHPDVLELDDKAREELRRELLDHFSLARGTGA